VTAAICSGVIWRTALSVRAAPFTEVCTSGATFGVNTYKPWQPSPPAGLATSPEIVTVCLEATACSAGKRCTGSAGTTAEKNCEPKGRASSTGRCNTGWLKRA
jgi:hypothetical protein